MGRRKDYKQRALRLSTSSAEKGCWRAGRPPLHYLLLACFAIPEGHPSGAVICRHFVLCRIGRRRGDLQSQALLDHHPAIIGLSGPRPSVPVERSCHDGMTTVAIEGLIHVSLLVGVITPDRERGTGTAHFGRQRELSMDNQKKSRLSSIRPCLWR